MQYFAISDLGELVLGLHVKWIGGLGFGIQWVVPEEMSKRMAFVTMKGYMFIIQWLSPFIVIVRETY